nr:RNA-directed DNA polymerase, eukaryota, reverse transcriptase zinc-binding domain protein [Tanacetum cinerariifolium]
MIMGLAPFRFYHYWLEIDGFSKLVNDSWNEAPVDISNGIRNFMKKLHYLKNKIREWNYANKSSSVNEMTKLKKELHIIDEVIDNGKGSEAIISKRLEEGLEAMVTREELKHAVWDCESVIPAEIGMPTIRTAEVNVATNDDE